MRTRSFSTAPEVGVSTILPTSLPSSDTTIVGTSSTSPNGKSASGACFERSTPISRGGSKGEERPSFSITACRRGSCSRESLHQVPSATVTR